MKNITILHLSSYLIVRNQSFPTKINYRQGRPLSIPLFNIIMEVVANARRPENGIKGIWIEKNKIKLSWFLGLQLT